MFGKKPISHQRGFTLIELMISVTLTVMLLLTAASLFITFLIGSGKTTSRQLVKNEGSYAIEQMEFLIRNATNIVANTSGQFCEANMTEFVIQSLDGGETTLTAFADITDNNHVKIASSSTSPQFLTSSKVVLSEGPTFNCSHGSDQAEPYVTISFKLQHSIDATNPEDLTEEQFLKSVSLRNF